METIRLKKIIPLIFKGMEDTQAIRRSEIWEVAEEITLEQGCRICLQAESGGGKSSLLSFIYGNRTDYQGDILFDNRNIRSLSAADWADIRRRHIALLPQEMRLFPDLTVKENIDIKNRLTDFKSDADILEMLDRLGISNKVNEPVGRLSVGQQQRVALVRTLCQPFDFIFLDEPVSHLDRANNLVAARMVEQEAWRQGAGIVSTSVGNPLTLTGATTINL